MQPRNTVTTMTMSTPSSTRCSCTAATTSSRTGRLRHHVQRGRVGGDLQRAPGLGSGRAAGREEGRGTAIRRRSVSSSGRNVSGPTATYRSVAKLDHVKLTNGSVLNMKFSPGALKDETSLRKFASMTRTFLETGGFLVQFNIVDTATLRAAQTEPEKYRDLLVRVATYSARLRRAQPGAPGGHHEQDGVRGALGAGGDSGKATVLS